MGATGVAAKPSRALSRRRGWLLALFAAMGLVLGGGVMPAAQAEEPTVLASGAYGDCPVKLWSDGTLEFTCSVLDNTDGKGWSGDLSNPPGQDFFIHSERYLNGEYRDNIIRVKSGQITAKGSLEGLFGYMSNLTDISTMAKWDTSRVTNMSRAFTWLVNLTNIDALADWDVSSVTNMSGIFSPARFANVDALANWDTSQVTDMSGMFGEMADVWLQDISGLANWDTSQVTDMSWMFSGARITNVDALANWDTSQVTDMSDMFSFTGFSNIDGLAEWDVSNVTDMAAMFMNARGLTNVDALANWDTSSLRENNIDDVGGTMYMFEDAQSLKEASFANPKGFAQSGVLLDFAEEPSDVWGRISISNGAKPNLKLPEDMVWVNTTRDDNKHVSSADMTTQIKAGAGEGVWKRIFPVTDIYLGCEGECEVNTGATVRLWAGVEPWNASDQTVTWSSSDTLVATVDANGKVTGKKAGTVTITATAKDGSGKSGSLKVTVTAKPAPSPSPTVTPSPTSSPKPSVSPSPSVKPSPSPSVPVGQCSVKSGPASFRDVPGVHPFVADISWLSQRGITTGWADGTFRPSDSVTRAAFAAFLYRMAGCPSYTPPAKSPFVDVPTSHQFYREISWLAEKGVSKGWPDRTFRPEAKIQRDALSTFLYRFAGEPSFKATKSFKDTASSEHKKAIDWFASTGISTGWADGTFRPSNETERGAIAAFLHRFSDKKIPIAVR